MTNCPLCNKILRVGGRTGQDVYCPTQVECRGKLAYHYKYLPIEYVYVYPYRLMDNGIDENGNGIYQVHVLKEGEQAIRWHYICDLPKFPLGAEEQLVKRLKMAVVFS